MTFEEELIMQEELDKISNHATKSEKASWIRKKANLTKLVEKIRPIEDQILSLRSSAAPIYDELSELRQQLVLDCIHPIDMLIKKEDYYECKFCNRQLRVQGQ